MILSMEKASDLEADGGVAGLMTGGGEGEVAVEWAMVLLGDGTGDTEYGAGLPPTELIASTMCVCKHKSGKRR